MKPFKIGHYTDLEHGTGCTVIICPEGTRASAYARGAAPGTREYALLSPIRKVDEIHALLFTGGSAFGLDAAAGVMCYLAERNIGYATPYGVIPIVPAAVIYDLYTIDSRIHPTAENAYQACRTAESDNFDQGNIGAGTGATVGKWAGIEHQMKGGLGFNKIRFKEAHVAALAVVNPVGDVVDENGKIVAGAQSALNFLAEDSATIRWNPPEVDFGENTILVALMTDVHLTKTQLYYLAERAHNGIVRAVVPAHTSLDGDIVFALSNGEKEFDLDVLSEIAVEATRQAIINAVKAAEPLAGIPAANQLPRT